MIQAQENSEKPHFGLKFGLPIFFSKIWLCSYQQVKYQKKLMIEYWENLVLDRQTDESDFTGRCLTEIQASNNSLRVFMDVEIYFIVNTVCFEIPDLITWNLIIQLSYRLFFPNLLFRRLLSSIFQNPQRLENVFFSVTSINLKSNYYIFRFYLIILRMVVKE